jgi:hypothetical protein
MRGAFIAVAVLCATASLHAAGKSDDRADRILVKPKLDVPAHRIAA